MRKRSVHRYPITQGVGRVLILMDKVVQRVEAAATATATAGVAPGNAGSEDKQLIEHFQKVICVWDFKRRT